MEEVRLEEFSIRTVQKRKYGGVWLYYCEVKNVKTGKVLLLWLKVPFSSELKRLRSLNWVVFDG